MAVSDLPNPHMQLVFAMLLFRDRMIGADEFRAHAVSAFGEDSGAALAEHLLTLSGPVAPPS